MRHSQTGLTLIEIVIGMALLSSSMVVATLSYTSISKLQQKGIAVRSSQQSGRYALELIARDIRNSETATVNDPTSMSLNNSLDTTSRIEYTYDTATQQILRSSCEGEVCSQPASIMSENSRAEQIGTKAFYEKPPVADNAKPYIVISFRAVNGSSGLGQLAQGDPYSYTYNLQTMVSLRGR